MHSRPDSAVLPFVDHRGGRRHRFMESADINAAFKAAFRPLQHCVRRGLRNDGQLYAIEMDDCVPGELLGTTWIPTAVRGFVDPAMLLDDDCRRALFDRLLAEPRPEALIAFVAERDLPSEGRSEVLLEIASADGCWTAAYPVRTGRGWHRREIDEVPHRRVVAPGAAQD